MKTFRFSLVELIIVVGIILIILLILLPAVNRVRQLSATSVCTNNLKQIGSASFLYQQDYNAFTMPAKFASANNYNHWANYVYQQVPVEDIFLCPAFVMFFRRTCAFWIHMGR